MIKIALRKIVRMNVFSDSCPGIFCTVRVSEGVPSTVAQDWLYMHDFVPSDEHIMRVTPIKFYTHNTRFSKKHFFMLRR